MYPLTKNQIYERWKSIIKDSNSSTDEAIVILIKFFAQAWNINMQDVGLYNDFKIYIFSSVYDNIITDPITAYDRAMKIIT